MEVPQTVMEAFSGLKAGYPYYISLARINGKFYVYRSQSFWDSAQKRVRTKKTYLGRIEEDGTFIEKKVIQAPIQIVHGSSQIDEIDKTILTHLSMNCRIPLSVIAKRTGLSVRAVENRKKKLEKRFGIRYLASIVHVKLNFSPYLLLIKFLKEKPPIDDIRQVFEKEPHVQLVMTTQGEYDLLVFMLAESTLELENAIYILRGNEKISKYEAEWNATAFQDNYSYITWRDNFFQLLEKKVWHRSKVAPRPPSDSITRREYILLRELNRDGAQPFSEIDKRYNFGNGAAKYTFEKLRKKGIIFRETLTMHIPDIKYNAAIIVEIINESKFIYSRESLLKYMIKDTDGPTNTFAYVAEITAPNGFLFILPVINEGKLEEEIENISKQIKGITIKSMIITQTVLGELCYRRIDNNQSSQMEILVSRYKIPPPKERVDYETEKIESK
ncbi:MAG: Lrp/AsnC family transcriptional regulator [Candidatus Micrarchaeia archaeon]